MAADRPAIDVAVVLDRQAQPNRWQDWGHAIADVVPMQPAFGTGPRVLHDDGLRRRQLFPGLRVELFQDEAEGYYLNLATPAPVWFVMWRIDEEDPSRAWPERVTLSYNEAGRLLDAQERVDNVPLPADVVAWLQAYVDEHYRPEPKQRKRPASFVAPGKRS